MYWNKTAIAHRSQIKVLSSKTFLTDFQLHCDYFKRAVYCEILSALVIPFITVNNVRMFKLKLMSASFVGTILMCVRNKGSNK